MACVYIECMIDMLLFAGSEKMQLKKNRRRKKKDCNRRKIKRPRGTTRGPERFECHGHGLQVRKSVCVCVCARTRAHVHTYFNGATIKQVQSCTTYQRFGQRWTAYMTVVP